MDEKNGFTINKRDRVLRAWQNSTELVRDYQAYSQEIEDDQYLATLFSNFAEDEALHASDCMVSTKRTKFICETGFGFCTARGL